MEERGPYCTYYTHKEGLNNIYYTKETIHIDVAIMLDIDDGGPDFIDVVLLHSYKECQRWQTLSFNNYLEVMGDDKVVDGVPKADSIKGLDHAEDNREVIQVDPQ